MRTVGPVGAINEKTYTSESLITLGYVVMAGVADGNCTAMTALGQPMLGIASDAAPSAGYATPIVRMGDARAIAGAAIPYGALVKGNAAGQLIPCAAGDASVGRAESTASGVGDEFLVFVFPGKN